MANTASTWQYVVVTGPLWGVSHVSPQIPKMAIRGSYEAALRNGVTTALDWFKPILTGGGGGGC